MERSQKKIAVSMQRMIAKDLQGQSTICRSRSIPLELFRLIFASSILLLFPAIASFTEVSWIKTIAGQLCTGTFLYTTVYVV
jgi:preprotein translocase subunit SecY